jgi:glyoxylase-like metal-dependent hydrolase (beta-lactamase superfamily II)
MQHLTLPVTAFSQNCSLVWCPTSRRGALVDPGGEPRRLLAAVAEAGVTVERILLTHGHLDHVGATVDLARELGVPIEGPHVADRYWLDALPQQAAAFGLPDCPAFLPDRWLGDGDAVPVGDEELEVLHCPGHTPGHVVFFHRRTPLAFVGDVLFAGSIGRTDFPGGNFQDLMRSIRERLLPLGDAVRFVPGHGPESTFGVERRTNPFVAGQHG